MWMPALAAGPFGRQIGNDHASVGCQLQTLVKLRCHPLGHDAQPGAVQVAVVPELGIRQRNHGARQREPEALAAT